MIQSINLSTIILLILFGIVIAMLEEALQKYMKDGHIFHFWKHILLQIQYIYEYDDDIANKHKWYIKLLYPFIKPLGLCPYCHSVWLAIVFYLIYFPISFNIILLIGIVYYFIDIFEKKKLK